MSRIRWLMIGIALGAVLTPFLPGARAAWSQTQLHVYQGIRIIFPRHYKEARRVFWCESRYDPWATNGQYHGVPQLSASWRAHFNILDGHWWDQLRAAHTIYRAQGWTPWSCQP